MIVSRDKTDGTIFVMAAERGLAKPMMKAPDGTWRVGVATADELEEFFVPVTDEDEREALYFQASWSLSQLQPPATEDTATAVAETPRRRRPTTANSG